MKKFYLILGGIVIAAVLAIFLFFFFSHTQLEKLGPDDLKRLNVDFDTSMNLAAHPHRLDSPMERKFYETFKSMYEKNNLSKVTWSEKLLIPKIIHQIWLGSAFPDKYRAYQASWKKYNPDWEYRLWTEAELKDFPMQNRDLYENAKNYGEKSDIARYEILYQLGGLYVDTDYECIRPFDLFNHCYDFYIGIQPLDTSIVQLGIGLIGAAPGHPLLKVALDSLRAQSQQTEQIIAKTGPIFFTQVFVMVAPYLGDKTIAFPPTYFYPRGYTQAEKDTAQWLKPESFAVHQWEGSWMKKEAFVK